ncbi:MAG: hypothetical protein LCH53_04560 [Bacteroidetes bacterium]|nr:hypothetical protein [Bacteroidota bacterium]
MNRTAQQRADDWNRDHAPGAPVSFRRVDGLIADTHTTTRAWADGANAFVYVEGYRLPQPLGKLTVRTDGEVYA